MEFEPTLVFGLYDLATVRAPDVMDMAILLHDGLAATYLTSICHVRFHDTTRLVGVGAFSSGLRGLRLVPAKWRYLVPPTSGVGRSLLNRKT